MDKEQLEVLIEKNYPSVYSNRLGEMAEVISAMDGALKAKLVNFLETGQVEEVTVEGWQLTDLITERKMNELAAFLTLDWLLRDPENAKASLKKGSENLSFSPRS